MVDPHNDQAAGLREMFRRHPAQLVCFAGALPGVGCTSLAVAMSIQAARSGLRVVLIDEHQGVGSATQRMGLTSRLDLLQAINRDVSMKAVKLRSVHEVTVIPAARLAVASPQLNRLQEAALDDVLGEFMRDTDLIIIDAQAAEHGLSRLARGAHRMAVVAAASGSGVTSAYSLIKRHAGASTPIPGGKARSIHVALSRVAGQAEARQAFASLNAVVSEHLGQPLHWLGALLSGETRGRFEPAGADALKIAGDFAEKLFVTRATTVAGAVQDAGPATLHYARPSLA